MTWKCKAHGEDTWRIITCNGCALACFLNGRGYIEPNYEKLVEWVN